MSFKHTVQIQDTVYFFSRTEMYTLENQAFVAICDQLFLALFVHALCLCNSFAFTIKLDNKQQA